MLGFLRRPNRPVAAAILALSGGAFVAASSSGDVLSESTVSISSPLRRFLSRHLPLPLFATDSRDIDVGIPPPNYSAAAAAEGGGGGGGTRCCPGCLGRNSIADAAAAAGPAVVNITITRGIPGLILEKSIGSGTIIDPNGTVLTCAHVVVDFEGMKTALRGKVAVTLQDGRVFEANVVNADLHSDIAVLKIKSKMPLPAVKLGSSGKLRPGDWVVALGCPLSLQNTVTSGIVSCVDRKSSDLGLGGIRREYLQTDCAINEATLKLFNILSWAILAAPLLILMVRLWE
ncbi:putative protease Do-like 14 [Iris pallida]|uniref:Protease Do-like 14 n=1 Tax=Iris pallida TaxID=29817 RepID=A0AAX6FP73_IRIPA|nr:putative protease Do-like 14 [Iris pallida]